MLLCSLILAFIGFAAPRDARDAVTITLSAIANVEGTSIELREVATVAGADDALTADLEALELGYSPSPGYTRLLFAEKVAEAVRRARPEVEFVLAGAATCRVAPRTQVVPHERLEVAARQVLEAAILGDRVSITLRQALDDVIVPIGSEEPTVQAVLNTPDVRSGIQTVSVRIEIEGRIHASRQVMFDVQRWQTVAVLRRGVASGAIITPDLVDAREVLIAANQREPALTADMLIGSVAARNLEPGRALGRTDVHRPKMVEAQAPIIVEVRHGQISARATAIALEDGSGGDRIRIRIVDSGREMQAVVVSRDLVIIELAPPKAIR